MKKFTLILAVFVSWVSSAHAATITVNTINDEITAGGNCSLREAIRAANANSAAEGCTAGDVSPVVDTIVLPAGTYTLSLTGTGDNAALTGDLDILGSIRLQGAGAQTTIIDGNGTDRVFDIGAVCTPDANATLEGITIRNGHAVNVGGGGIFLSRGTLDLKDSILENNVADTSGAVGGGLYVLSSCTGATLSTTAILENSLITNNTIFAPGNLGGGIYVGLPGSGNPVGTLILVNTTVSNNRIVNAASSAGAGIVVTNGVAIIDRSTISGNIVTGTGGGIAISAGNAMLINSTLSANQATVDGGGLFLAGAATVTLNSVTVADNVANSDNNASGSGGGIAKPAFATGTITLQNSLIAQNIDTDGGAPDCSGALISQDYNLIGAEAGCSLTGATGNNLTGISPLLDALSDNGGPTLTHALQAGSPAIDAGNPAGCSYGGGILQTDQRGAPRAQNGRCDIGAYEFACGNGAIDLNESCDDGNLTDDGNGCSVTCQANAVCGDGVVQNLIEQCDDGNAADDLNGCSVTCQINAACGDGALQSLYEGCDDGNTTTESCAYGDASCTVCAADCTPASGAVSFCGDGILQAGDSEQCDDGNTTTEACAYGDASCTVCAADCTEQAGAVTSCGDGTIQAAEGEDCDDGNTLTEACNYGDAACIVCAGNCASIAGSVTSCGDGILQVGDGEQCDDGNTLTEACAYGDTSCTVCAADCSEQAGATSSCGDGSLQPSQGEQCDDGNAVTEACDYGDAACAICASDCTQRAGATAACGDGALQAAQGEECDDGNLVTEFCAYGQASCAVCAANCAEQAGAVSSCGDGTLQALEGEECDDGNTLTEACAYGDASCLACAGDCQLTDGAASLCGDGIIQAGDGEQCDDGAANASTQTACQLDCRTPPDPSIIPPAADPSNTPDAGQLAGGGGACSLSALNPPQAVSSLWVVGTFWGTLWFGARIRAGLPRNMA